MIERTIDIRTIDGLPTCHQCDTNTLPTILINMHLLSICYQYTINISYECYRRAINNANDMVLMCYAYSLTSPCHCYYNSHHYRLYNVLLISYLCAIDAPPMCYRYATNTLSICYNAIGVLLRCYQHTFTMLLICEQYAMNAIHVYGVP